MASPPMVGRMDTRWTQQIVGVYSGMHAPTEIRKRRRKAKLARKARLANK